MPWRNWQAEPLEAVGSAPCNSDFRPLHPTVLQLPLISAPGSVPRRTL